MVRCLLNGCIDVLFYWGGASLQEGSVLNGRFLPNSGHFSFFKEFCSARFKLGFALCRHGRLIWQLIFILVLCYDLGRCLGLPGWWRWSSLAERVGCWCISFFVHQNVFWRPCWSDVIWFWVCLALCFERWVLRLRWRRHLGLGTCRDILWSVLWVWINRLWRCSYIFIFGRGFWALWVFVWVWCCFCSVGSDSRSVVIHLGWWSWLRCWRVFAFWSVPWVNFIIWMGSNYITGQ